MRKADAKVHTTLAFTCPRPFGWRMKPLTSAQTTMRLLANGRRELTIVHDLIRGVTPAMLHWWFCHIDDVMVYAGQTYPRYLVWHPTDHIYYRDLTRATDGSGHVGTTRQIVEAFQGNPRYLINIVDRVSHLGDDGILLTTEAAGIALPGIGNLLLPLPAGISTLEHRFLPQPNGTRYESRLLLGAPGKVGALALNPCLRHFVMNDSHARAWLQHNVEEVGNFEYFLPALWAQAAG
ncbi:MAG: hypothetical protein KDE58_16365 [Caldilineaceae bacterium]|nr:hypothetical protein [Caldilineaceae bacterium]